MSSQNLVSVYRREPTPQEAADASVQIAKSVEEIGALQEKINDLQSHMRRLQQQQFHHYADVKLHRGVITLARRIPSELLAYIFELSVDSGWTRAPVIVSHVCSQWRLAAQDPRVWSRVYVNLDDSNTAGRTTYWLRMAASAPLHITIVASSRVRRRQVLDIMALLSEYADQWSTLTVDSEALLNIQAVTASCSLEKNLPHLRHISVISTGAVHNEEEDSSMALAQIFTPERVPELRSLSMDLLVLPATTSMPMQLRSLVLTFAESQPGMAHTLMHALNELPHLEKLSLSLPLHLDTLFELDPDQAMRINNLKSLTIFGPTDLNGILYHIQAPSLLQLHLRSLEDLGYRQTPVGPSLHAFLQGSTAVKLLELYDIDLSPEYFASCFALLSNLEELRLHESSVSAATLKLLYGWSAGGGGAPLNHPAAYLRLCPKLTKLDLRWCGLLAGHALVNLVRSRLPTAQIPGSVEMVASPITDITAINCCFIEERHIIELAKMTVCRVVINDTDYCYQRKCCDNLRYRQRLRFRHFNLPEHRVGLNLIL
ncbi:hypothetical protein BXZ70DRAFT_412584 [Cristinia sonorae]|uniref:F-box domain-containing protein n=1 Tax=Cristinia sonorae TaxID=1940300 RepID=A0A8K0XTW0_9AGAR|nr:hypothetical protein BXZ70DRAFT_412584 [Cristinia sonorae]